MCPIDLDTIHGLYLKYFCFTELLQELLTLVTSSMSQTVISDNNDCLHEQMS